MAFKYGATPEVLGYKPGAILLALTAGTTDGLENVQSVQGQPYSLLRGWQAATLSYVTLGVDASGSLLTAGGGGAGSTAVDVTLKASTAAIGSLIDSTCAIGHVAVDSMPAISVSGTTAVDLSSGGSTKLVGHVVVDSMPAVSGSTTVDANLSSAGSTRLIGRVEVNTPTTSVTITNPTTSVTVTNPSTSVTVTNPSTAVDATLSSAGSTRLVGQMTVANPTTAVSVSSGVVLGAGSSANTVGAVALVAGSSSNVIGAVVNSSGAVNGASTAVIGLVAQGSAGSSADPWNVQLVAGSTGVTIGAAALLAGSSANVIGQVVLQAGTTLNYQFEQVIPFSSGNAARTTVTTSVDVSVVAANSSRKALVIANLSTVQTVSLGLTTAAVTTALGGASLFLAPASQVTFGLSGGMPLFTGPIRGINITSTAVAGGVAVTEFT